MNFTILGPILATLLLVLQFGLSEEFKARSCIIQSHRLPQRVKPTHYELVIRPNLDDFTFEGQVDIDLSFVEDETCDMKCHLPGCFALQPRQPLPFGCDPKEVIMNAGTSLNILQVEYTQKDTNKAVVAKDLCTDQDNQMISIRFDKKLHNGSTGRLRLIFSGEIRKYPTGFYRSPYLDSQKQTKYSAATFFEPNHARQAFPCFDEPAFKATFNITIEHDRHLRALSNMDTLEEMPSEDKSRPDVVRTRFAQTPLMSTYLVAFVIGEFDQIQSTAMDGRLPFRAITPPGQSSKAEYILDTARRAFVQFFDYFNIEQPLKKIDLVFLRRLLPGVSAMENWGLVTLFDLYFLEDNMSIQSDKSNIIVDTLRQLSNFWLGNLVSPKWWDSSWLKESFGVFISYEAADKIYPKHNFQALYLHDRHIRALNSDYGHWSHHHISMDEIKTAAELNSFFDHINYDKNAAIVRMISKYVGDDEFKSALRLYLRRHSFSNADATDLWSTIKSPSSSFSIDTLAASWLNQSGHPLLTVSFGRNRILIQQKRFRRGFSLSGMVGCRKFKVQRWIVPVSLLVSRGDGKPELIKVVLDDSSEYKHVPLPKWFYPEKGHWLKLNANFEGFYRVKYDEDLLGMLKKPIITKELPPIDRLNFLDDLWVLYNSDYFSARQFADVLDWFQDEDDAGVMYSIINIHRYIGYGRANVNVIANYFKKTGNFTADPSQSLMEIRARAAAANVLVYFEYEPVISEALRLFESTNGDVPIEFRKALYAAVAADGSSQQIDRLIDIVNEINEARDKPVITLTLEEVLTLHRRERQQMLVV